MVRDPTHKQTLFTVEERVGFLETALAEDSLLESRCLGVVYDRVNLRKLKSFLLPGEMENYLAGPKPSMSLKRRMTGR